MNNRNATPQPGLIFNAVRLTSAGGLLLSLSWLAACKVGPDYVPPQQQAPQTWTGLDNASASGVRSKPTTGASDVLTWWTQFNDPILTSLIERASRDNLSIAQAQTRIRQARAAAIIAGAALEPTVDAAAATSRSGNGRSAGNLFRAGFDASWEIDVFGGNRRAAEAADAQVQSAQLDRESVLVSLAGEVATTYLQLRGAQQQLAIARRNLAAQQQTLELTQQRFEAGFVNALDVANSKAQAKQTESAIPSFDAQARTAMYSLALLLAQEPGALIAELSPEAPVPEGPPEVPVGLPSELLQRRPDIRKAESDLKVATARVGVAVADQYPKFSLTGSLGLQGNQIESLGTLADRYWSIGPSVRLPLFSGGRIKAGIEQAKATADSAMLSYKQSVLTALSDVESALVTFTNDQRRQATLSESAAANRQAVDLALQLYSAGRTDFINVLAAQRQLYSVEAQLVQTQTNIATDLVSLFKALGGGWAASEAAIRQQNP